MAHGGTSVAGSFIQTLTMIDVATGWTDCHAVGVARGRPCHAAVERAQSLLFLGHWRRERAWIIDGPMPQYPREHQQCFQGGEGARHPDEGIAGAGKKSGRTKTRTRKFTGTLSRISSKSSRCSRPPRACLTTRHNFTNRSRRRGRSFCAFAMISVEFNVADF